VVYVDEHRLDTKGRLYPLQGGGERKRVTASRETNHDPIVSREPSGTGAGQQSLLEPVRGLPACSAAPPRGKCCTPGSISTGVAFRGVHLVPTGGIEPPAKGL
jgi:hypothetical protein